MKHVKAVIDTNVILSGLLSQKGASYKLLQLIPKKLFTIFISVLRIPVKPATHSGRNLAT
jgi:predicted nucleic acid-binding protein